MSFALNLCVGVLTILGLMYLHGLYLWLRHDLRNKSEHYTSVYFNGLQELSHTVFLLGTIAMAFVGVMLVIFLALTVVVALGELVIRVAEVLV